jgi:corticotropin releasing hormone receptor 1
LEADLTVLITEVALRSVTVKKYLICFLLQVLITKLRATNNAETQQYRKATKALLVLIPLLGITYILVITGPAEGVSAVIYDYVTAVLLSTQVIQVFCSLNYRCGRMGKWFLDRKVH